MLSKTQDEVRFRLRALASPTGLFVFLSPYVIGGYYEWVSCLYSLCLLGYLVFDLIRRGYLTIPCSNTLFAAFVVAVSYGLSAFWAVDKGMAFLGFIKFLPLPLFALVIAQTDPAQRKELTGIIPLSGFVMVIVSVLLGLIPVIRRYFFISDRLAGFFQYPNTFALFLLVGITVTVFETKLKWRHAVLIIVLLFGIALSGSRTVFILLILTLASSAIFKKDKRDRMIICAMLLALLSGSFLYVCITHNYSAVGRYLTTSLTSSTLLGRLLYFKDALPVIASHPFGLGYLGYYFLQGSFQTGVYSVLNVHNEFLQILLDIGWIPAGVCIYALIKSFINNKKNTLNIVLLSIICIHCLFDFDLQFVSVGFVLVMTMSYGDSKTAKAPKITVLPAAVVLCILCCYFGSASAVYCLGNYKAAVKIYSAYTMAWIKLLPCAESISEMDSTADKIIRLNQTSALAYSAKARAAYAGGDFGSVIQYKKRALEYSKYSLDEYLDYFNMLYSGVQLYTANNDTYSAAVCRECLLEIPELLSKVEENTSSIAFRITDTPNFNLPADYIAKLKELNG